MAVRLALLPLSFYAIRGQASQARLAPQIQALRQRHAGQPDRLQRELAALYRREGTGMFAGCLPLLLQLPFLSVMYRLFRSGTIGGRPNGLLGHDLFGAALGSHWLSGPGPFSAQGAVFVGLFGLLAVAAWLGVRVTRTLTARTSPASASDHQGRLGRPIRTGQGGQPGQAGQLRRTGQPGQAGQLGRTGQSGQADVIMGWVTRAMPYATLAVAAIMPLAAGLYLLTTTAWAAAERAVFGRRIASARAAVAARSRPARSRPSGTRRG
jgi:YidC/Oxa1 family membrane protein insertase